MKREYRRAHGGSTRETFGSTISCQWRRRSRRFLAGECDASRGPSSGNRRLPILCRSKMIGLHGGGEAVIPPQPASRQDAERGAPGNRSSLLKTLTH